MASKLSWTDEAKRQELELVSRGGRTDESSFEALDFALDYFGPDWLKVPLSWKKRIFGICWKALRWKHRCEIIQHRCEIQQNIIEELRKYESDALERNVPHE